MEPKIIHQTFYHDDHCPTLFTRNMADCKCKVEIKLEKSKSWAFTEQKIKQDFKNFVRFRGKYNWK